MKKLLFGAILIIAAFLVNCTSGGDEVSVFGDIYGTITDSKSGEPVRNAEVILSPGNKTTVSGSNGHYEFKTLEAGQYKVGVETDGYEYNSRQVTVVPGQNTVCDFRLTAIVVEQVLKVTPTTLDFGTSQNEMSVTITNEGTEETEWSVNLGNNNWLSANPKSGRIAAGKSQTIVFTVNRDLVAEDKSAVVNIAAFGNTYPISVSCTPKKTKGELSVEPTSLNFGEDSSELEIKIKNTGDGDLNWTISGITADCLSVSDASGKIAAGGNKVVKVKLDREKLEKDLSTTFTVSDGNKDVSVAVTAKKKVLKGELVVEPTSLNFGEDLSEQTITIKNVGDASLKWTISKVSAPLSVSEKEGELAAGGSKVVKVLLDRNNMNEDVNTSFVVSDGEHEKKISVAAKKIVYAPKLELSTTELNFGLTATELSFNINNTGNADLKWSIPTPVSNCISVTSSQGTITPGSSHKVVVKLDRSTMPETLNTTLTVTDGANDVKVVIKAEKGKAVLGLSTNELDFGDNETMLTFIVGNMGEATANLRWLIDDNYISCLSVTPTSGVLEPNNYTTVTVTLNRSAMTSDIETQIDLYDLDDNIYYYPIKVKAKHKGSSGSGDSSGLSILNDLDEYFSVSNVKCVGYKGTGIVTFSFVANGLKDEKIYFATLKAYDSNGDTYSSNGYIANMNIIKNTPVKIGYDTRSTQISNVSEDVKSFTTVVVPCHPSGSYSDASITFNNVPIEWISNDDSGIAGLGVSNPYPQYMRITNIECIGYKSSGKVQLAFTATNSTSSSIKVYFGAITAYSPDGDTFKTSNVGNVELLPNTPTKVKYNSDYTQMKDVDTGIKKFVTVKVYCSISLREDYLTLTNVPITWK